MKLLQPLTGARRESNAFVLHVRNGTYPATLIPSAKRLFHKHFDPGSQHAAEALAVPYRVSTSMDPPPSTDIARSGAMRANSRRGIFAIRLFSDRLG